MTSGCRGGRNPMRKLRHTNRRAHLGASNVSFTHTCGIFNREFDPLWSRRLFRISLRIFSHFGGNARLLYLRRPTNIAWAQLAKYPFWVIPAADIKQSLPILFPIASVNILLGCCIVKVHVFMKRAVRSCGSFNTIQKLCSSARDNYVMFRVCPTPKKSYNYIRGKCQSLPEVLEKLGKWLDGRGLPNKGPSSGTSPREFPMLSLGSIAGFNGWYRSAGKKPVRSL